MQLEERDQIKTLIWANGKSRTDYACFGDVVDFQKTLLYIFLKRLTHVYVTTYVGLLWDYLRWITFTKVADPKMKVEEGHVLLQKQKRDMC